MISVTKHNQVLCPHCRYINQFEAKDVKDGYLKNDKTTCKSCHQPLERQSIT
jgi:DNA polymerase III alpha subunit (gram-positive type)